MTKRILVVEDEYLIRTVSVEALADARFEILEAENAADAIGVLEKCSDVQLLFTDIRMPGPIDGLQLARLVHERWPKIKLLLTSGDTMLREADIPDNGHFLAKPYRLNNLCAEVEEMLAVRK